MTALKEMYTEVQDAHCGLEVLSNRLFPLVHINITANNVKEQSTDSQ